MKFEAKNSNLVVRIARDEATPTLYVSSGESIAKKPLAGNYLQI
jgi:hypothetical protein